MVFDIMVKEGLLRGKNWKAQSKYVWNFLGEEPKHDDDAKDLEVGDAPCVKMFHKEMNPQMPIAHAVVLRRVGDGPAC